MSKNPVQFQKGMSLPEFMSLYGQEAQCRAALFRQRWPLGYRCPACGCQSYCELKRRPLYQCRACRHQASLTAGTLFEQTKLPLTKWFLAIYLVTQNKDGLSAMNLMRQLGVSYNTAWGVRHKLMQAMLERERREPLSGRVEVDDAYWGGERPGKRGRGSSNKTPFLAAVATSEDGRPLRMKMHKVGGFRKRCVKQWAGQQLNPGCHAVTDGLNAFRGLDDAGIDHEAIVTGGGRGSVQIGAFIWVNTVLGNVKNALRGTYHKVSPKHLPRYLAEFEYRFNRRFDLAAMVPALLGDCAATTPMPGRLLKLAEACW